MVNGDKIKKRRQAKGWTLTQAAEAARWGRWGFTRWHDIEAGRRRNLTLDTLAAIADALGCQPADLLDERK